MKRYCCILLICIVFTGCSHNVVVDDQGRVESTKSAEESTAGSEVNDGKEKATELNSNLSHGGQPKPLLQSQKGLYYPMKGFQDQITVKPFGVFIHPDRSPVQPERFSGYHTGVDIEVIDQQQDTDVPVYAIADGTIHLVKEASGYGGVIVIIHIIDSEDITAVYGHVRLSSVSKTTGDVVEAGEQIALLGAGFTDETDGERKHLHFGLISGQSSDIRGYVSSEQELSSWIDPEEFF